MMAVEIIHWWKKQIHRQYPAKAFALHSLFTQKISVQIHKKQQTWQESVLPLRRFPAQNMLSSSLWSYTLGALHCFCEISLTLVSNSWRDMSPAGSPPKKKIESPSSHSCYMLSFFQNTNLLALWMGRGKEQEGAHGLAWKEKKYLSALIRVRVWAWKLHSGHRAVAWTKAKSHTHTSRIWLRSALHVAMVSPAFQRCWSSAAPTTKHNGI